MRREASLSLAKAASIESARCALMGRLEALSRNYGKPTDAGFEGERLKQNLEAELSAFEGRTHRPGPRDHFDRQGFTTVCARHP
jgi:hypothetical protein